MNKTINFKTFKTFLQLILLVVSIFGFSQTPGFVIRDGANNIPPLSKSLVLDPNQDGYVSATNTGFTTTDLGLASEIPYVGTSLIFPETTGDLQRGPSEGFSDFVPDANGKSFYTYFDGTNLLFRLRLGNIVAGAKAYSILIDSDGLFGVVDPTYTAINPGFEYEVVVQTGFKIAVYNVDNGTTCTSVWESDLQTYSQYYQTAIALSNNGGNPDYFIDFYVPLSSFTGSSVITSTTPLRYQVGTVMAPKPYLCGPVSDSYPPENVASQPTCTPEQIANGTCQTQPCTSAPIVSVVRSGATSISGTWTKSSFSTQNTALIEVFVNGVSVGTVTTSSGGTWSIATSAVPDGAIVYATAVSTGESKCNISNQIKAQNCTPQNTSDCPNTICISSKGMEATGVPGAKIYVYRLETNGTSTLVYDKSSVDANGNWSWNGDSGGGTGGGTNICNTGANGSIPDGTYYLVQVEPGKCPSACNFYSCVGFSTSTTAPTIANNPIFTSTNIISGTAPTGSTVRLMLNNVQVAITTAASGTYTFNDITNYYAQVGNVFTVIAQSANQCASTVSRTVSCVVLAPTINNDGNGNVAAGSQLSGKSTEIGATVNIYNTSNTLIGTTSVLSNGTWLLTSPAIVAGISYYATISNSCGVSSSSNIVLGTTPTSSARCGSITGPILDNATSVSGTVNNAVANTTVTLYIDSFPLASIITNTTTWSIPVNTNINNSIYAGGVLSIGIKESGRTEVICSNTITVGCSGPALPLTNNNFYYGDLSKSVSVIITNSQLGVLYTLEKFDGSDYGLSAFGNGGNLILTTYPLDYTGTQTFYVRALSLISTICTASSLSFTISTFCYKPAQTTGTALDTNHGITALGRAGDDNSNWPMARKGAWTVLEAKTKGFVVNRMASSNANVGTAPSYTTYLDEPVNSSGVAVITNPVVGMMFYDTRTDCLKINIDGTRAGWKCFNTQTCPD